MKNFHGVLFVSLALLALVGCATQKPYDGIVRSPKSQIDIFEEGAVPGKPYTVIMEYSEKGDDGSVARVHQAFIARAKALGADAIILKPGEFGGLSATPFSVGPATVFSAVAIVYQ